MYNAISHSSNALALAGTPITPLRHSIAMFLEGGKLVVENGWLMSSKSSVVSNTLPQWMGQVPLKSVMIERVSRRDSFVTLVTKTCSRYSFLMWSHVHTQYFDTYKVHNNSLAYTCRLRVWSWGVSITAHPKESRVRYSCKLDYMLKCGSQRKTSPCPWLVSTLKSSTSWPWYDC